MTDVRVSIEKTVEETAVFSAETPWNSPGDEEATFEVSVTVTSKDDSGLRYEVGHEEILFPDEAQALFAVLGQALQWRPGQ